MITCGVDTENNEVSENSGKIAEISSLIEEIGQQTTMLALNASIEASLRLGQRH